MQLDTRRARVTWQAPALLALTAALVRLPTLLSTRSLSFDDGVYGASVVDLRRGLVPYRDVFSSQGPLHLPLLYAGDLLGFRTIDGPRVTPLIAGVVIAVAVWASAQRLGARRPIALVAGALVATTGTMLWTTGQITGDGPAAALAAVAVWCALRYRDEPSVSAAVLTGVMFGAALATKPIVVATALPIAMWLASTRRRRDLAFAASATAGTWLLAALPWGLTRVWQQSVEYHTGAGLPHASRLDQLFKLMSTLATRDGVLLGALALGALAAWRADRELRGRRVDLVIVAVWCGTTALVLVFEKALFANHVAVMIVPLALLLALRPPPLRWFAVALVVLVPWEIANQRDLLWPQHFTGVDAQVVARLRALPRGSVAIADDPGLVWRAGLATPAQMNDTTDMRVFQHSLTTAMLARAAAAPRTCAVVLSPFGFAVQLPGIHDALRARGYELAHNYPGAREVWIKRACASSTPGA